MDREGFLQFLRSRRLTDAQMAAQAAIAERFEVYLEAQQPPARLETAGAGQTQAFVDRLIAEGANSEENLIGLARYALFVRNIPGVIAVLELLDGAEAMEGMVRKVDEVGGAALRDALFDRLPLPPLGASSQEKAAMTRTVMQRLEAQVDDETYRRIFSDCFRDLPDSYYLKDQQDYGQVGDFDRFLELQHVAYVEELETLKNEGRLYFSQEITAEVVAYVRANPEIEQGVRRGNILYVAKIPYQAHRYLAESDPQLKRYYACHCPWARESLRVGEQPVSARFCQCSAGFHKKRWEMIFGRPLQAEVLESVLRGDDRCRFAIHLPPELFPEHEG